MTQHIEIIGILIAAGNRQHASAQDVAEVVDDAALVARVGNAGGKPLSYPQPPLRLRTPPSDVSLLPSNAAVTFSRQIAGNEKRGALSSAMAGVALSVRSRGMA